MVNFPTLSTELLSLRALSEFGMTHTEFTISQLTWELSLPLSCSCDREDTEWRCREDVVTYDEAL